MGADLGAANRAVSNGIEPTEPAQRRVALLVSTANVSPDREDAYVAAGLARQLARLGLGVRLVPPERWYTADYTDDELLVAMVPTVNVRRLPAHLPVLAWIRNVAEQWREVAALEEFSAVLTASELSRDLIAERFDGPLGVLSIGFDKDLLDAARPSRRRRRSSSAVIVEHVPNPDVGWGNHTTTLFDALASGSPVVTNTRLGLRELGLERLPSYRTPDELAEILGRARAGEFDELTNELRDVMHSRHTYAERAASFVEFATEHNLWERRKPTGRVINFFPDWSKGNPYQRMLYGRLPKDVRVVPSTDPVTHLVLRDDGGDLTGQVLHVHWQDYVVQPAPNYAEASRRLSAATANMTELVNRGVKLVWTIHNRLPHDVSYYFHEIELCRFLAREAHVIHVLSEQTLEAVRDLFEIDPAKVVVVEHGSYTGVYPELLDRASARAHLNLLPSERIVLFFGGVRPYKGLEQLIETFAGIYRDDPTTRLLIVGQPGRTMSQDFLKHLKSLPFVTTVFGFIPESDVHMYFRAADVQVAPYTSVLNSGSVLLGLGYGLPIVAPKLGALSPLASEPFLFDYGAGNAMELDAALRSAIGRLGDATLAERAVEFAQGFTGDDMSEKFVRDVLGRVFAS